MAVTCSQQLITNEGHRYLPVQELKSYFGTKHGSLFPFFPIFFSFSFSSANLFLLATLSSAPIQTFEWGVDTVLTVKFNPVETSVLASTAMDRSVILYDIRGKTPIKKIIMEAKSNSICWSPMEAFNFTFVCGGKFFFVIDVCSSLCLFVSDKQQGNEDTNVYTFDMRRLDAAKMVHKDHVSAV
jgi:WD repeat and SOF domain-containing protein 1